MIPFLKNHERLILGLALLATILLCFNWWINSSAANAAAKDVIAQQQLQAQKDMNAHLQQDAALKDQQYQQLLATITQQIQGLQTAIAAQKTQLVVQQQKDKILPLPELGSRWESLIGASGGITTELNGMLVTDLVARTTVNSLEEIPSLQSIASSDNQIVDKQIEQINSLTDTYQACQKEVSGLNDQITKADTACKAQIADVKAQARKSKRNWFIAGLLTGAGIVARLAW